MPQSEKLSPSPPGAPRVLFVDDEPGLRHVVPNLLRREGYVVDTACDGVDGWDKISGQEAAFDVVITDRQMPRMDGLSFVRKLRQARFPGRIIVFSAAMTPRFVSEMETLAVDALVPKGTPAEMLLAVVARIAGSRLPPPKTRPDGRDP